MIESPAPRFLRLPAVMQATALGRSALYARIARGEFPVPRALSARCSVWLESEVFHWIDSRPVSSRIKSPAAVWKDQKRT